MDDEKTVFNREEHDHGTDEYVSDCNRLPFERPILKWKPLPEEEGFPFAGFLVCLLIVAVFFGGCWAVFVFMRKLFLHFIG